MPKVLVIHGAGMNMRGKVQLDIFGPMTLPEYDERIRGYAKELGVEVEIFHSHLEGEIVNRLYAANDQGFDAAIFNPAAFGTGYPALVAAISQVKFPTTEVHISNPIRRGPASQTAAVSCACGSSGDPACGGGAWRAGRGGTRGGGSAGEGRRRRA
jgi:3-dehydroquinate dehydratase-2